MNILMKRRTKLIIYLAVMILAGVVLLFDGLFTLGNGDIQLPGIYVKIVYFELSLISFITLMSFIGFIGAILSARRPLSNFKVILIRWIEKQWVKWSLFIIFGMIAFVAGQMLLQIPTSKNPLTISFLLINRPFFTYLVIISLVSLLFLSLRLGIFQYLKI